MDSSFQEQTDMLSASAVPAESACAAGLAEEFLLPASRPAGHVQQAIAAYAGNVKPYREDELILQYMPLVHKIVNKIVTYLPGALSKEDLVSAGMLGLVKAARDFDPSKDAEFKTYAYIRIRGSVIDEMRNWSFAPSGIRKQFNQIQEATQELLERHGQMPTDEELAGRLGIGLDKMYRLFETARARHFLSIHGLDEESPMLGGLLACPTTPQPDEAIQKEELIARLSAAIQSLPEKQRRIVVMYYHQELTMKQIGEVLEITESRVSQLHAAAVFKLAVGVKQD